MLPVYGPIHLARPLQLSWNALVAQMQHRWPNSPKMLSPLVCPTAKRTSRIMSLRIVQRASLRTN
eukprot:11177956-Lingulodinium_polyedra.AAC.1